MWVMRKRAVGMNWVMIQGGMSLEWQFCFRRQANAIASRPRRKNIRSIDLNANRGFFAKTEDGKLTISATNRGT